MIKHIVMWTVKDTSVGDRKENALTLKAMFEALKEEVSDVLSLEVGINEVEDDNAMDVVLISTFRDEDALNRYHHHPRHLAVADFVKQVRVERRVVDFSV